MVFAYYEVNDEITSGNKRVYKDDEYMDPFTLPEIFPGQ